MTAQKFQQSPFSAAKWMTVSSYLSFVTGFVNSIFITRGLGPQAYGVYSYLIWIVSVSVSLTTGGLNITIIRFVAEAVGAKNFDQANAIFAWLRKLLWLAITLLAMILAITLLFPKVYPTEISDRLYVYLGFSLLCAILKALFMFDISVSKGHSIFYTEALTTGVIGLSSMILSAILFFTNQGLDAYLWLFLAASLAHPIIASRMMRKHGLVVHKIKLSNELKSKVWSALLWNVSFTIVGLFSTKSVDSYLLGAYALTTYIGYYNIASALAKSGFDLLSAGFSSMLLPYIARAGGEEGGREKVQEIFSGSVRFYQCVGILVACGAYLMSESMVTLLYGAAYREAIPALRVMALVGGILLPNAAFAAIFIATDNHRARLMFIFLSSVISVLTSVIFIPWLGYQGALISVFLGNVTTYVIVALIAHFMLEIKFPLRNVLLQWISAGIPFAILNMLLPSGCSFPVALLFAFVFGLSFLILSVNIGAWEDSDLDMLRRNSVIFEKFILMINFKK